MRVLTLVVSILLAWVGLSHASFLWRSEDGQVAELSGTITTVDEVALRVRPEDGSVMTFVVDDPSSLPTGLAVGTRVIVRYETREGGGRRLLRVSLAPGASAPAPELSGTEDPAPSTPPSPEAAAAPSVEPPARGAPDTLAASLTALQVPERPATQTPAPAAAPCPLQLIAVGLLVATGTLLVFASWR